MQKRSFYLVLVLCVTAYVMMSDALIENDCSVIEAVVFLAIENLLACATWYFLGKIDRKENDND